MKIWLLFFSVLATVAHANAATLQGSVGGGYQYTTSGTDTTTEEALANEVAAATCSSWTDRSIYDNKFKSHVDTVAAAGGATWQTFKTAHGGDADFIGIYVDAAAVSPDSRPKPPKCHPRNATTNPCT